MRNVLYVLLLVGLFIGCGDEEPPAPAVLLNVIPKPGSTVNAMEGILLEFNTVPENLKIEPSLPFSFLDERENKLVKAKRNLMNVRHHWTPGFLRDTTVLILGPPATRDRVSIMEVSWGKSVPQEFMRLSYITRGPD